jgi:hypothetical protein
VFVERYFLDVEVFNLLVDAVFGGYYKSSLTLLVFAIYAYVDVVGG